MNYLNSTRNDKKAILFTGAHHSRELTSISMNLYLILRIAYGYHIKDRDTMALLNSTVLYFVPILNIDGFKYISEMHNKTGTLWMIRKNRNNGR